MMVSIRRGNNGTHSTFRITLYSAILATFALTAIYLLSNNNNQNNASIISQEEDFTSPQQILMKSKASSTTATTHNIDATNKDQEYERDEEGGNILTITPGSITYSYNNNSEKTLNYYHCGPLPTPTNTQTLSELMLLHGAAFTKEDWKSSGILQKLCEINNNEDGGDLSISAWDLSVAADGDELLAVYHAMVNYNGGGGGILSGRPVTFVTPSASGKAMTTLAETSRLNPQKMKEVVGGWISVASGAILKTSDDTLQTYVEANIPVLGIHGDQDAMGKKVSERLVELQLAKRSVELEGRHPVYLDSPDEFVMEVLEFMEENGL